MWLLSDLYGLIAVALYLIAVPLILLAVPVAILFGITYLLAGPELRMKMVGWAPGVRYGVRKTLRLAEQFQHRSAGTSR